MRATVQFDGLSSRRRKPIRTFSFAIFSGILLGLTGCGEPAAPPAQAETPWTPEPTAPDQLPARPPRREAASSSGIELVSAENAPGQRPTKGSSEWLLMEIAHLRNAPVDLVRQPIPGKNGEFEQVQLTPEQAAQEQIRRHEKVVELAMEAISKTHENAEAAQLFNSAVHYLSDSRLQLALAGNKEQGQLLDENAEALFHRDPTSFAAMDAASHMLDLTHTLADRHAQESTDWAIAFARQSRLFAERFPQEASRAAVNAIAAGRLCERLQLDEEAEACLAMIDRIAPDSPYSEQVAGSLRRLRLPGQVLTEFGGSTFDGSFTSIERYRGQTLLIAFWASNSEEFRRDYSRLQALLDRSGGRITAVGVNMDRDEHAVERFLQESGMKWKNVFYSDPEKRGSRNVIARHYGVINVPEYWLVDANGVVRSIHLDVNRLEQQVTEALAAQ